MAKPNYSFEKRQREIAKKKKQDEKAARKREARAAANPDSGPDGAGGTHGAGTPGAPADRDPSDAGR